MEVFKSGDIDISYYTKGSGEDVLLLHGFPDSSALWDKQVTALSKNYRVIVPDITGFGSSSKPQTVEAYRLKCVANNIFDLLDHLKASKVRIAGHDWGAVLTWYMAGMNPQRFHKVAVLSCGHAMSFFPQGGLKQRQLSWYMLFFVNPEAEELLQANDWALWKVVIGEPESDFSRSQISQMAKEGALTAGLNWYRANCSLKQLALTQAPPSPKLNIPVLGLWSTGDKFLTEEQMTASAQYVEEELFSYKRIDNAGHWMQRDAPNAVNEALLDFFGH